MHVGMTVMFQHPDGNHGSPDGDASLYETEYRLADQAEALGFDSLWGVEHHLNGYAMCPDPLKFLMYFAGRTTRIRLGTMVVVVPWHQALRVCEDVSVLEHVSGGRMILGLGRGVAKTEFDAFGVDMNQTRDLLIENVQAIKMGLEQGYIELDGSVVKQPYALVRPKPPLSFERRLYGSAMSPTTYPLFGKLGLGLLFIPGMKPWEMVAEDLDVYRDAFREHHGCEPPPPIFAGWVFCDEDGERARTVGFQYIRRYVDSALAHYEYGSAHLAQTKGYEAYTMTVTDEQRDYAASFNAYGTPDECFEKIKTAREKLGAAAFLGIFNYSGMGEAEAQRNLNLFAEKVLPRLKALEPGLDVGMAPVPERSAA